MATKPEILVTNDDGIDSPGIRVLAETLEAVGDVTVVAPADDQSGCGLARSWHNSELDIEEYGPGYRVFGTPSDCVAVGVTALDCSPDIVVSGCNDGPNIGSHIMGQSGTVSAALEAGFLGLPAIAVSMYDLGEPMPVNPAREDFEFAAEVTTFLLEHRNDFDWFEAAGCLNVNAPSDGDDPMMRLTRPTQRYDIEVTDEGADVVGLEDRFWRRFLRLDVPDPIGTDRRAVIDGEISVSPLTITRGIGEEHEGKTVDAFRLP